MVESLKQQWNNLDWLKISLEVFIGIATVLAIFTAYFVKEGNSRWADKAETERAIHRLETDAALNNAADLIHHQDKTVHMAKEVKDVEYVTRREWVASQAQQTKSTDDFKREFNDFAKEQRAVNREVLSRLGTINQNQN